MNSSKSVFFENLPGDLALSGSEVESILLREYGSIFATAATPPDRVIFADEDDVERFQAALDVGTAEIGGFAMRLQKVAMDALLEAVVEANRSGFSLTP